MADDNFKFDENEKNDENDENEKKVIQTGRKHCGKRRNCSLQAISPFSTVFSKRLVLQTLENQGLERVKATLNYYVSFGTVARAPIKVFLEFRCSAQWSSQATGWIPHSVSYSLTLYQMTKFWTKLKAFADDKKNVAEMMVSVLG